MNLPISMRAVSPGGRIEESGLGPFFDERWGAVLQMGLEPLPPWEPQIRLVTARLSRELLPDGGDTLRQRLVSGHGFDRQRALDSAMGEAIERVFGGFSNQTGESESISELPLSDLRRLPQFSQAELDHLGNRYGRLHLGDAVAYVPATDLATGRRCRVPAQMVFCPYHPRTGEKFFWEPTATGLASGRSCDSARIAGLLEVIERDALAVSWILKIPGQELPLDQALGKEYETIVYELMRGHATARLAIVSLNIPLPVCVAAIYDETSKPCAAFGAAAALDIQTAASKALCEAALVRYTIKLRISVLKEESLDPSDCNPATYQEHGLAWANPESLSKTEWLFGNRRAAYSSLGDSNMSPDKALDHLLGVIGDAGYGALDCDLSTPELTDFGRRVHRMIVPELQPLNPGRYRRMLDSERLIDICDRMGSRYDQSSINNYVHPFC